MDHQLEVLKKLYSLLQKMEECWILIPIVQLPQHRLMTNTFACCFPGCTKGHFLFILLKASSFLEKGRIDYGKRDLWWHEFSFLGQEQYKKWYQSSGKNPKLLVKKTFPDEQMANWRPYEEWIRRKKVITRYLPEKITCSWNSAVVVFFPFALKPSWQHHCFPLFGDHIQIE